MLLHTVLLAGLLRQAPVRPVPDGPAHVTEVRLLTREPVAAVLAHPHERARRVPKTKMPAMPAPVSAAPLVGSTEEPKPGNAFDEVQPALPAATSRELLALAKRDMAAIVRELDKDRPDRGKPLSSELQKRLDSRFEEAHAAARPDWWQAASIAELHVNKPGVRVYRITTALGSYCVTYAGNGGRPTYGICPE